MGKAKRPDCEPMARCCDRHDDWRTLADHLVAEFTDLPPDDVAAQLSNAKRAVEEVAMGDGDQLFVAELIARQQLLQRAGRAPAIARLDPEVHAGRAASAS